MKKNELEKFGLKTTAVVTDFTFLRKTSYELEFKYVVDGKEYYNTEITSSFHCINGIRGCVGETFNVLYSREDPAVSRIDLDRYNKFIKKSPTL
jgi:hypothetical protein